MIQFLKTFMYKLRQLFSPGFTPTQLTLIRITEKFDVVERVPINTRINFMLRR
jgi:hypothetical protein